LQTDNYNLFAEIARPFLLKYLNENTLDKDGKRYLELLKDWNLNNAGDEKAATIFEIFWDNLDHEVFDDEYALSKLELPARLHSAVLELLMHDSTTKYVDNIMTTPKETLFTCVNSAYEKATKQLLQLEKNGKLIWNKYQDTRINHITKIAPLSRFNVNTGGGWGCINATKQNHGPSWRMIVHLTDEIEAYGVYPGGQSGNPGSKYYDNFIDTWAAGKYNTLLFLNKENIAENKKIKWHLAVEKG